MIHKYPVQFQEWLQLAQSYSQPMREAVRRFRHHKLLKESTDAQVGIYYWVPLPNNKWDIMKFYESHYGDTMHEQVWKTEVVPYLLNIWKPKVDLRTLDQIRQAYAGLPRGRVSKTMTGYVNYHGNDAPTKHLDAIIKREFGLPEMKSVFDDHERTLPADVKLVNKLYQR